MASYSGQREQETSLHCLLGGRTILGSSPCVSPFFFVNKTISCCILWGQKNGAVFLFFLFFIFVFYKNIFSIWKFIGIYPGRPAAGRSWGAAAPLPGDRPQGTCAQFSPRNFFQKCPCRPVAGRPGPGRLAAGRLGYIPVNFQIENIFL